jgi:uncharacterized protein (DUF885 family)
MESEMLRYLSMPSQATTYELGERAWLDARRLAVTSADGRLGRTAWHAKALAVGPLGVNRFADELSVA